MMQEIHTLQCNDNLALFLLKIIYDNFKILLYWYKFGTYALFTYAEEYFPIDWLTEY